MALGCWPFAGGVVWGEQDEGESIATVHAALDAGINFFDTAEGYEEGHSERVLGRGLAGQRQQAVIASKVSPNHLTPEGVAAACEQSLENLQTGRWPNTASLAVKRPCFTPSRGFAMAANGSARRWRAWRWRGCSSSGG